MGVENVEPLHKPRARDVQKSDEAAVLYGKFLLALRRRAQCSAEAIADRLGYQRPTQVLRREAGVMGIPEEDIGAAAKALRCNRVILNFGNVIAFHQGIYEDFGHGMSIQIGAKDTLSPLDFFEQEIAAIKKDELPLLDKKMDKVQREASIPIFSGAARSS